MPYPLLLHAHHHPNAVYEPFGEWVVPWRFEDVETEYARLRSAVGLIDYSTQGCVTVGGEDRVSFLHNLLSNDIKRLVPGAGCRAALLTSTAKLIAELLVLADATTIRLLCDATRTAAVAKTLEHYCFRERVVVTNQERSQAVLALQGPRTMECLTNLLGTVVSLPQPGDHMSVSLGGIPGRLVRYTLTGEAGVLCLVPAEQAQPAWEYLQHAGSAHGLGLVAWEALNVARIEGGLPWFGQDMDEETLLPETGLERVALSETKGCYVGQEIMARLQSQGSVSKRLMGLELEGNDVPEPGASLLAAASGHRNAPTAPGEPRPTWGRGEALGRVTSACFSPTLGRAIAMGYVKRSAYAPGTPLLILHRGTPLLARVVNRPFVPAK